MKKSELLLPAGNEESLKAAIANGADAVYFAGSAFGARAGAENFDREQMAKALDLCRLYRVKAYITINTLLGDGEISDALDEAKFLYDQGADALIVQDFGFAMLVKKLLPDFPLHGSTQMTVHNAATARFCYEEGFRRVILAREVTVEEIASIQKTAPGLELEVFVHGALCISYSGQCLMSSLIGGRSGNRGKCAQPCRMAYDLHEEKEGQLTEKPLHLLSPRDLNTLDILPEILDLGIASLKIEGRMRRPEYVATVGRVYRRAIDSYEQKCDPPDAEDKAAVAQVFNRDFTSGYFKGNPGIDLMSHLRPNNRGVFLGRVKGVRGRVISIQLEKDLHMGDGIEIWVKVGGRMGATVEEIRVAGKKTGHAKPGQLAEIEMDGRIGADDRVFKTYDAALMGEAQDSYAQMAEDVPLHFFVKAKLGEHLYLEAKDEKGRHATYEAPYRVEKAVKTPTGYDGVEKQVSRLGGSGFYLSSLEVDLDEGILIPASSLNQARRELTADLIAQSRAVHPRVGKNAFLKQKEALLTTAGRERQMTLPQITVKVQTLTQAKAALEARADFVYFAPYLGVKPLSPRDWEDFSSLLRENPGKIALVLPRVHPESFTPQIKAELARAAEFCSDFLVGQAGDTTLLREIAAGANVYGDFSLNVFNRQTFLALRERGFERLTYSLEMNKAALAFQSVAGEVVVHGFLPMMVSRHCLLGAILGQNPQKAPCGYNCQGKKFYLSDRLQAHFPIYGDVYHQMHIYNGRELALITEAEFLRRFAFWRIEGQFYESRELKHIISLYRDAREGTWDQEALASLLNQMRADAKHPYTKGHFYRGAQ